MERGKTSALGVNRCPCALSLLCVTISTTCCHQCAGIICDNSNVDDLARIGTQSFVERMLIGVHRVILSACA